MNNNFYLRIFFVLLLFSAAAYAQYPNRQDAIWARTTTETITLDGVMNEPGWASAEVLQLNYGQVGKLPTSGYTFEFNETGVTDPTHATIKFLVKGNQLYLGFNIPDSSVNGSIDWARWDGILMSIKNKSKATRPASAGEFFYTYWYVNTPQYNVPGGPARFIGTWGNFNDTSRTDAQRAVWDGASVVVGGQANDAGRDQAWNVEMRISLDTLGYNLTRPEGDIIMLNFSIWDCDYLNEGVPGTINTTRTHFQSPWGNTNADNVARIHTRPDVTLTTSPLPTVMPDVVLQNGSTMAEPSIDGLLNDAVWNGVNSFEIAWDDAAVRNSYPGIGPFMSGQFQPELVAGSKPPILDPSHAKVKIFFRDHYLYMSADIDDQIVQGTATFDQVDGIGLIIGDRNSKNTANFMETRLLRLNFAVDSTAKAFDYLTTLLDSSNAQFAVALKGATTVSNNTDIDEGFTLELKVDLAGVLGYPGDLGDKLIFLGAVLYDGDSFDDPLNNYGTRTWWFREHSGGPTLAWCVMDPNNVVGVEDDIQTNIPNSLELYGNYPNPFNPSTTIKLSVPFAGSMILSVYDMLGQNVYSKPLFAASAGTQEINLNLNSLSSGIYFYKISMNELESGKLFESRIGKMILMK